jgi:uncharacterized protein YjbI with pentapeptide repeats
MVNADLRGADLRRARLQGADLRAAKLDEAKLGGATLTGTRYDARTRWPAGFDARQHRARRERDRIADWIESLSKQELLGKELHEGDVCRSASPRRIVETKGGITPVFIFQECSP